MNNENKWRIKMKDISGQRFGRLVAMGPTQERYNGNIVWKCVCDCGNIGYYPTDRLIAGKVKSCGCLRSETTRDFAISMKGKRWKDLTGQRFGRLQVLEPTEERIHYHVVWKCMCDCGNITYASSNSLIVGDVKSCGCLCHIDGTKHYGAKTRLYAVWAGMKARCYNKNCIGYKHYGGRGITICDEWKSDFSKFREWALAHGYDDKAKFGKCTIDRIDVTGNYEPSNCRWVDMKIQNRNKRKRG